MEQLNLVFGYGARGLEYIGVVVVLGAAVVAIIQLLSMKTPALVRKGFAGWILTGLEFIIAAEIILATLVSGREELLILGAVVVIRILLGYSLRKEII